MNFIKRLTFFSGGFMIGLFFLMFFLSGKKTSCNYMPNSRVKNDILKKNISFSKLKNNFENCVLVKNAIVSGLSVHIPCYDERAPKGKLGSL